MPSPASGAPAVTRRCVLLGWALRNPSTTTDAQLDLIDATGGDTDPVCPIALRVGETSREWFGDSGIMVKNGLYVVVNAGTVVGSLFIDLLTI